jgi:hypothetical protein
MVLDHHVFNGKWHGCVLQKPNEKYAETAENAWRSTNKPQTTHAETVLLHWRFTAELKREKMKRSKVCYLEAKARI